MITWEVAVLVAVVAIAGLLIWAATRQSRKAPDLGVVQGPSTASYEAPAPLAEARSLLIEAASVLSTSNGSRAVGDLTRLDQIRTQLVRLERALPQAAGAAPAPTNGDPLQLVFAKPKAGPPSWTFNERFSEFSRQLGEEVNAMIGRANRELAAEECELSVPTIHNLIKGGNPELHTLWKLCAGYQVLPSDLLRRAEARIMRPSSS